MTMKKLKCNYCGSEEFNIEESFAPGVPPVAKCATEGCMYKKILGRP